MATDTNFLPEDYVEKKTQRRTNLISLSLFVVVMTAIIGAFLVTDRQWVEVARKQSKINAQYEEAAKRLEQLDNLQARKDQMLRKAKVTGVLIERIPRSFILAELINQMPSTLSLLELELQTKAVRKKRRRRATTSMEQAKADSGGNAESEPKIQKSEATMRLVGVAPTDVQVAQFMTSLSRSTMFTDVNLAFSEEVKMGDDHLMRKFRIDMKLNQDITPEQLEPKLVQRRLNQNPMSNTIQIDATGQLVVPTEPLPNIPVVPALDDQPSRPSLKD